MKIFLVPPNEITSLWDEVRPLMDKAFDNGLEGIVADDLIEALQQSRVFMWIATDEYFIEAVCICEFVQYPRKKSCYINAWATKSGYEFDEYYGPMIKEIENFSKINGCDFIEAKTRKGLARKLKSNGWTDKHSLLTKTLF